MKSTKKKFFLGLILSLGIFIGLTLQTQNPHGGIEFLTPGEMTHGHYQIELDCKACHEPNGGGFKESSCQDCHQQELDEIEDSHPQKKFRDPRNADRLQVINAMRCVSCHTEHQTERTGEMGLTIPQDFCFHCHEDIAQNRPSHEGMGMETCATAGCHNYHDNKALYEDFIEKHLFDKDFKDTATVPLRKSFADSLQIKADAPDSLITLQVLNQWKASQHYAAEVNCTDCHKVEGQWKTEIGMESCTKCHEEQNTQFLESRHGMRLKQGLPAMQPKDARLPMHAPVGHKEMTCTSCHGTHNFNTKVAAVQSCVQCHKDDHTQKYFESKHYTLWMKEQAGELPPGSGVSCATCHLPRVKNNEGEIVPHHNQNHFLRPNEKMIRSSCLECHGLEFSLKALSDTALTKGNFQNPPSTEAASIDMVRRRLKSISHSSPKESEP